MNLFTKQQPTSRSQAIRQKREKPSPKRQVAARKPAARTVAHGVPVVSRSSTYTTPLRQAVAAQPRRRVYYAVGANGVETRMPSLPIIHMNWQWVSGLLTVGCIVLALIFTNVSSFQVNSVEVVGIQRLTAADLQTVVQTNATSVFTLQKQKVINALQVAYPELADVSLSVKLPDGVLITARERQPIIAWKVAEEVIWIDPEGVVMPVRGEAGDLLVIRSDDFPPLTKPLVSANNFVDYALMVLEQKVNPTTPEESLNYMDLSVLNAAISMGSIKPDGAVLVYDKISGMGWKDPGGWRVYFGNDLSNIEFKQAEYKAILKQLEKQGIKPAMVSVEHVDSPYFRTE